MERHVESMKRKWILPAIWISLEVDFCPEPPERNAVLLTTPKYQALWDCKQRTQPHPVQDFCLTEIEKINGHYFKMLNLWYLLHSNRKLTEIDSINERFVIWWENSPMIGSFQKFLGKVFLPFHFHQNMLFSYKNHRVMKVSD